MTRDELRFDARASSIRCLIALALWGTGCAPAGCDGEVAASARPSSTGCVDRFMFVDDTRSVAGPDDRKRWLAEATAYIDKLAACDTLVLWWIDDATRTAAPVTSVACGAPLPDDATLDERLKSEQDLSQAKEAAAAGVRRALERRSSAQTTDVIGAFARVTLRAGHLHEIVLFTDAVNETPEINLATTRLPSGAALGTLAAGVVERRRWEPSLLAETKVFFVLSSTESGQRAPLNSVDALEGFYRALLSKLGAVVAHFGNQPAFTRM